MTLFYMLFACYAISQIYLLSVFWRLFGAGKGKIISLMALILFIAFYYRVGHPVNHIHAVLQVAAYIWMAFSIAVTPCCLFADFYCLIRQLAAKVCRLSLPVLPRYKSRSPLWLPLLLGICIFGYGLFEAYVPIVNKYTIVSSKLPKGSGPIRIAHISDVHVSPLIPPCALQHIVNTIQAYTPDLIVSTGDLVDVDTSRYQEDARILASLQAPLGKYAVLGNHEAYHFDTGALNFTQQAGFTVLRGSAVTTGPLTIAGVDDPAFKMHASQTIDDLPILQSLDQTQFIVLLKHRPTHSAQTEALFDLQLSGHTHNGQVFPGNMITEALFGPTAFITLKTPHKTSYISTSTGVGFWGPPIRLLARAEIIIYDLVPE